MDLFEAIAKRQSYRGKFVDQPVPREDLRHIVEAGLKAPSGCNRQTTTFVIVDDPVLVRRINEMPKANTAIREAGAFIACVTDQNPDAVYESCSFQVEDCAAAVENMLLAVTAMGYASVWIDGWLRGEGRAANIGDLLGVPREKLVRVLLPVGKPAEAASP
jgi:nitroreductase